jgi:alkanesulfonate monooxygenase SsuD/methylene tetrahydromethanopterin reductase-like flavin-dependent oxidoreductase (luciferase family)
VARLGDGWLASAYSVTPAQVTTARSRLDGELAKAGRPIAGFPASLATLWTYVTDDRRAADAHRSVLARMLNRPADQLGMIGPAEECAATLRAYQDAGIDQVFVWPLADPAGQLERVMRDVAPLVPRTGTATPAPTA